MDIIRLPIESVEPYEKNPRKNAKAVSAVKRSISLHGQVKPIVLSAKGKPFEKSVICAGHTTVLALKELGYTEVDCVYKDFDDEKSFVDYNIRDNKSAEVAEWDMPTIHELGGRFDLDLDELGFEIKGIIDDAEVTGEVQFSEEVNEANNYVVLVFNNDIDWLSAQTHFDLKTVNSKRANGKVWSKGVGRVLDGGKYLTGLKE